MEFLRYFMKTEIPESGPGTGYMGILSKVLSKFGGVVATSSLRNKDEITLQ